MIGATKHVAVLMGGWSAEREISMVSGAAVAKSLTDAGLEVTPVDVQRDIEVRNQPSGKPVIALRGGARDVIEASGIQQMLISISHCRSHATAYALAVGQPREEES